MAIDIPFFSFYTFFVCWASIEFILLEASWCCFVWVIQRKEGFYGLYFTFSCTSLCCLPHFFFFFCLTSFFIESHALLRKFLICFERDTCFSSYLQHVLNFHLCNTCPLYNYMRTVHLLFCLFLSWDLKYEKWLEPCLWVVSWLGWVAW